MHDLDAVCISIHTSFAEGDNDNDVKIGRVIFISIHTFFAEGDIRCAEVFRPSVTFQSTPPSQKATANSCKIIITIPKNT